MSFWDAVVSAFGTGRGAGGNPLGLLSLAGAAAYSAYNQSDANTAAARIAAEAARAKARAIADANTAAAARLEPIVQNAAPAQAYLRSAVAADPYVLTPQQKQELEDIQRQTTQGLNASGLRGAGRSYVAAFRDIVGGAKNRMVESNIGRRERAASGLSGQFDRAVTGQAVTDASTGRAYGDSALAAGTLTANSTTANASLRGQAIGDIASYISQDIKDRTRESRYKKQVDAQTGKQKEERV